jgi:hypothetical protein
VANDFGVTWQVPQSLGGGAGTQGGAAGDRVLAQERGVRRSPRLSGRVASHHPLPSTESPGDDALSLRQQLAVRRVDSARPIRDGNMIEPVHRPLRRRA